MFGVTVIVKNSNKDKRIYSDYGISFDGKGSWSFCNDFASNVIIFGVHNVVHHLILIIATITFLILGGGPILIFTGVSALQKKV